jgi:hypothetical protein
MGRLNPTAPFYRAFVVACAIGAAVFAALAGANEATVRAATVVGAYAGCIVGLFVVELFRSKHL